MGAGELLHTSTFPAKPALDFGVLGMLSEALHLSKAQGDFCGEINPTKLRAAGAAELCCHSSSDDLQLIKSGNWTHFALLSRSPEELMSMRSAKAASEHRSVNSRALQVPPGSWPRACVKGGYGGWAEEFGLDGVWIKSKSKGPGAVGMEKYPEGANSQAWAPLLPFHPFQH